MITDETRRKIAEKSKARWADPAFRQRAVARMRYAGEIRKKARIDGCALVVLSVRRPDLLRRIGEAMTAQGYQAQVL